MAGKLTIAIVICAAVVAAFAMRATSGAGQPDAVVTQAVRADAPRPSASLLPQLPVRSQPALSASQVGVPAFGASPRQLREAFERSSDLFTLMRTLESAARSGDAEARWLVSRVQEYCAPVARSPVGFARDTALIDSLGLRAAAPLSHARNRVGSRCARFVPADAPSFTQLVKEREEAARAGSLPAEAALLAMGEPLDDRETYRADLVDRVQASGDPEAFVALAPAMGVAAHGDDALEGRIAGTQAAEIAWHVAGCRLGQPCGPDSALMIQYCANGGICSQDRRQDFEAFVREAAIPQLGADEIDAMVDVLVRGKGRLAGVVAR